MSFERFQYLPKHKVYERTRIGSIAASRNSIIVLLLISIYHIFYRQMFKHRMQLAQNKRLPQPTHTSITIRKRMDKLKFIMEHTRAHQQMVRTMLQPIKKISHQIRHTLCWRSHVHTSLIRKHAHTALTILPSILYKRLHHDTMSTQQVALLESIEMRKLFIGGNGVLHLLNLSQRGNNSLTIHNVSHLVFIEGISLYGKRTVNGLYLVSLAEQQSILLFHSDGITLHQS